MKKLLSVLLVAALLLGCLAGCGGNDDERPASTQAANNEGAANTERPVAGPSGTTLTETENGAVLTLTPEPVEAVLNEMVAVAVNQYLYATVKLAAIQEHEFTDIDELKTMNQELIDAYRLCDELCVAIDALALKAESGNIQLSSVSDGRVAPLSYMARALMATPVSASSAGSVTAKEWAEGIVRTFDTAPRNQGIKKLSELLGSDSKRAMATLQQAQNMIEAGDWNDIGNSAQSRENFWRGVEAGAKVTGVVVGAVITGGATGTVSLIEGGCILIDGVDAIISVGEASATIIAGENSRIAVAARDIQKNFATAAQVSSFISFGSTITNAGKKIAEGAGNMAKYNKIWENINSMDAPPHVVEEHIKAAQAAYGMAKDAFNSISRKELAGAALSFFGSDIAELGSPVLAGLGSTLDDDKDTVVSVQVNGDNTMTVKEIDVTGMSAPDAAQAVMAAGILPPTQGPTRTNADVAKDMEGDGVLTDAILQAYLDNWLRNLDAALIVILDTEEINEGVLAFEGVWERYRLGTTEISDTFTIDIINSKKAVLNNTYTGDLRPMYKGEYAYTYDEEKKWLIIQHERNPIYMLSTDDQGEYMVEIRIRDDGTWYERPFDRFKRVG